tara:strand:+ start:318 stop:785 length:468 start_codon:yes stop_codon:yes gene_type:complete
MIIERYWSMPNHKTFNIKPFKDLIKNELGNNYIDPFPYPFKQDAIGYLKTIPDNSENYLVFDPPYSQYQLKLKYKNFGNYFHNSNDKDQGRRITRYWSNCKKEISRIIKKNGKVISFGWNSNGIGKKFSFKIKKIVLVAHGSQHNDTIATVEIKI